MLGAFEILPDSLTTLAERARDLGEVLSLLPTKQKLIEFNHRNGPPCHGTSPHIKNLRRILHDGCGPLETMTGCSIPLALPCLELLNSDGKGAQFGWHCTLGNCSITMVLDSCEIYKEQGGDGLFKSVGVRAEESAR